MIWALFNLHTHKHIHAYTRIHTNKHIKIHTYTHTNTRIHTNKHIKTNTLIQRGPDRPVTGTPTMRSPNSKVDASHKPQRQARVTSIYMTIVLYHACCIAIDITIVLNQARVIAIDITMVSYHIVSIFQASRPRSQTAWGWWTVTVQLFRQK